MTQAPRLPALLPLPPARRIARPARRGAVAQAMARRLARSMACGLTWGLLAQSGTARAAETLAVGQTTVPASGAGSEPPSVQPAPVPLVESRPLSFAPLVRRIAPTVVNIAVTRDSEKPHKLPSSVRGTPLEHRYRERMRRHWNDLLEAGSGFIIDPDGSIVTNGHVVADADRITVSLMDGQEFTATPVGIDPLTDIAVIKIDGPKPMPYAQWGDSRLVQVGDWILAAGNPFGLGSSVTAGIVSARGRDIGASPFDDFLQLDAPINPGNSGGPTFNMAGQVVALNTAIVSPTGGSVGLGFSIPSEIVRPIVETLRKTGHMDRGWLGATLKDSATPLGAQVTEVDRNSPAAHAGLRRGDIVSRLNDERVESARFMIRAIAAAAPGKTVALTVVRRGQPLELQALVGHRPPTEDTDPH